MKALQFTHTGSLDALALVDRPAPYAQPGEAVVEIRAAGVNPSDVKNVLGRFPYTTLPRVPGRDFAGVVVDGPREWLGEAVWGTGREFGFTRDGSHAEHIVVPLDGLAPKPASLSFAQAASCGVPYTTAWDALERTQVSAGDALVVIGAGAVGSAAQALGRWRGAQVLVAVRRADQARELAEQGIETLLLEDAAEFGAETRKHFPEGADVVFDTTGHWLVPAVRALNRFGRIAVIAAPSSGLAELPVLDLYRRGGSVVGVNSLLYDSRQCAQMLDRFSIAFAADLLPCPAAPRQCSLYDGVAVYRELERGGEKTVFVTAAPA